MSKNKLILGIGITGMSCADFFKSKDIPFKMFDTRDKDFFIDYDFRDINPNSIYFKEYPANFLNEIDEVVISPGLDKTHKIFKDIKEYNINIITDIDIFKRYCDTKLISVTGTNGKTTMVTMLKHVLSKIGYNCVACGNNGTPPLSIINNFYDYVILELSSYQLEYMSNLKSFISIITNVDYDHFERHKNIETYSKIKLSIYRDSSFSLASNSIEYLIENIKNIKLYGITNIGEVIVNGSIAKYLHYDSLKIYFENDNLEYKGKHNLENILGVISVLDIIKIDPKKSLKSLSDFNYLPHRIELIKSSHNINWYNDSKSTNCASTKAALESIDEKIILILGGSMKDMRYESLSPLINKKVKLVIFIGENKEYIKKQLKINTETIDADSIESAVKISWLHSSMNDNILLSPASPSFDMFENYEKRGAAFVSAVQNIAK
jgi:UDP-N-acetylmuramoylalanine--D-glutamate ligase|tara:strand:+ start:158 stop:1465 length:1308 start_codon:yes stop_codon:yes gene_type:complete